VYTSKVPVTASSTVQYSKKEKKRKEKNVLLAGTLNPREIRTGNVTGFELLRDFFSFFGLDSLGNFFSFLFSLFREGDCVPALIEPATLHK
jgi:hypothetical protein